MLCARIALTVVVSLETLQGVNPPLGGTSEKRRGGERQGHSYTPEKSCQSGRLETFGTALPNKGREPSCSEEGT